MSRKRLRSRRRLKRPRLPLERFLSLYEAIFSYEVVSALVCSEGKGYTDDPFGSGINANGIRFIQLLYIPYMRLLNNFRLQHLQCVISIFQQLHHFAICKIRTSLLSS